MDQIEKDILKWYNRSNYSRMGNDVSVTELMKSPREVHLKNRYRPKVAVPELGNLVPSMTGTGLHDQFQRYLHKENDMSGKWQIERRLLTVIDGVRVSGRFDALYDLQDLYDIKVTRAWKFEKGDYSEWETQLNCYDWMLWKDGIDINSIKIMGIVLDWQQGQVWKQGYPQSRILMLPMKRWSRTQQEAYMVGRTTEWKKCLSVSDVNLTLCSDAERWASKPVWKLFRTKSQTRANKVFPTEDRAKAYMKVCQTKDTKWSNARIEKSTDLKWKKCESWCDVAPFCNQYQNKIEV
jgi:hypothetical protein